MKAVEIIVLNFSEIRRRSIKLWEGIPDEFLNWKPDKKAFSIIEKIRHILETEHLFHIIIQNRGNLGNYESPWNNLDYIDLKNELPFEFCHHFLQPFAFQILCLTLSFLQILVKLDLKDVSNNYILYKPVVV